MDVEIFQAYIAAAFIYLSEFTDTGKGPRITYQVGFEGLHQESELVAQPLVLNHAP